MLEELRSVFAELSVCNDTREQMLYKMCKALVEELMVVMEMNERLEARIKELQNDRSRTFGE